MTFVGLGLAMMLGCQRGEGAPTAEDAGRRPSAPKLIKRPEEPLAWNRLPLLPSGLEPAGWRQALDTWETATVAYATGHFETAAQRFLIVAETLMPQQEEVVKDGPAARVSSAGRCLAYENAARALRAGGQTAKALVLLKEAKGRDPACKHSLALRISRLDRLDTASNAVRRAGP